MQGDSCRKVAARPGCSVHRGGIGLGLEQPGHVFSLVGTDGRCRRLQTDVGLEPLRNSLAVLLPPAALPGLTSQGEQGFTPLAWATLTRELDLLVSALQVDRWGEA